MIPLAFLFDVDNTLLDNDGVKRDIDARIKSVVGTAWAAEFWRIYEDVRTERDVVDYPVTLDRFRSVCTDPILYSRIASLVITYPFAERLYPGALDTIRHVGTLGTVIILSDGDQLYQRLKIARSGLANAVDHHVLIGMHKEQQLPELLRLFPAERYVMVDDKPRILSEIKRRLPERFTTVHVVQGKYALDQEHQYTPGADVTVSTIADVARLPVEGFRTGQFPPGMGE